MSYRKQLALWISASSVLLIFTGTMLFTWIGKVSESQRLQTANSLHGSVQSTIEDLRLKTWLLLMTFKADADLDRSLRLEHYQQRYNSWHELSMHGPVVKRILFYDMSSRATGTLTELRGNARGLAPAEWGDELAPVRRHIEEFGFRPGQGVSARFTATWTFLPRSMALFRPIVSREPSPRRKTKWPGATGYLILKLDLAYIRDRLFPTVLDHRFGELSESGDRYEVRFMLDGESLYSYRPSSVAGSQAETWVGTMPGYALSLPAGRNQAAPTGPADYTARLPPLNPALNRKTDEAVRQRGMYQRIRVRGPAVTKRLRDPELVPSGSLSSPDLDGHLPRAGYAAVLAASSGLPRLFLGTETRHRLRIEARRIGIPLTEAVNRAYNRSIAAGIAVIALLMAAMVMLAITGGRAARLAELRLNAAANQAHQLLTPIAVVIGLADSMVQGGLGRDKRVLRYGTLLRDYGKRLNTIVERAMQVSANDTFDSRLSLDLVDVSAAASTALEDVQPLIDTGGFSLERCLTEELPKVRANAEALRQCIGDLLSNAVKYGESGRWVKVETCESVADSNREVLVRVHDRGSGIPAREMSRIFEPYYRVPHERNASIPGVGLGLQLVRETVKKMGGKLTLETQEGQGSVFTIHLPVPE